MKTFPISCIFLLASMLVIDECSFDNSKRLNDNYLNKVIKNTNSDDFWDIHSLKSYLLGTNKNISKYDLYKQNKTKQDK